jgi:ATP-dependent exoDNAse (exonuclease V) alpha subunit
VRIAGGEFAAGDLVVVKLNDRRLGVENGNRGRVVAVDVPGGALRVELSGDRTVTLPRGYLARKTERGEPTLVHGYAGTAHVAQGSTTDRAFVLGSDAAYREWGYVAWSRARLGTRFYVSEAPVNERDEHHSAAGEPRRAFDDVVRTMQQSRAQRAAVDLAGRAERDEVRGPDVADPSAALGERARELLAQVAWRRARRALDDARRELTKPDSIERNPPRHGRSL